MLERFVGQGGSGGVQDWMMLDDAGEAIWSRAGTLVHATYAYALLNVSLLNKSIYIGRYLYKSNDTIYVYIFRNVKPSSYGSPKPGLDLRFRKFFQGAKGYSECNKVWIGGRRLVKADGG